MLVVMIWCHFKHNLNLGKKRVLFRPMFLLHNQRIKILSTLFSSGEWDIQKGELVRSFWLDLGKRSNKMSKKQRTIFLYGPTIIIYIIAYIKLGPVGGSLNYGQVKKQPKGHFCLPRIKFVSKSCHKIEEKKMDWFHEWTSNNLL